MKQLVSLFLLVILCNSLAAQARLNQAERDWLASRQEIVFAGQISYPPFEFIHPRRGEYSGMTIELVRWMATEYGFSAVFKPLAFAAAQDAVLSGDADALTGIFWSEEREKRFDFSMEVFSVPAHIFVRTERTDILELEDLQGRTVAVQKGDYAIEYLAENNIDVKYILTDDFSQALNAIVSMQADAIIGDEQVVLYYIYAAHLESHIKRVGEPLYTGSDCMAVAEGNTILQSILNKALLHAQKTGVLSRIYEKWLGSPLVVEKKDNNLVLPFLIVVIVVVAVSVIFILWNFQLKQRVRIKTEELSVVNHELRRANESLTLANSQLLKDMEERARMEEERRKLEARMIKAQKSESLALMAGGVAHDFSNMLTAIMGGMDLALMSLDNRQEAVKYLKDAMTTAKESGELARRMLDFSGRSVFNRETVDFCSMISAMSSSLAAIVPGNFPVKYNLPDKPVAVWGDPLQFRQMVSNLTSNALEASCTNCEAVEISVYTTEIDPEKFKGIWVGAQLTKGHYAVIEVRDYGEGMDSNVLEHIFEPFYTTKSTGRGLGLAALSGMAKSNGGALTVESTKGKGSIFRLIFPLMNENIRFDKKEELEFKKLHGKIMIVDDEQMQQELASRFARSLGLTTINVSSSEEAIKILAGRKEKIDIVLLDLSMPGQDPYDTFSLLKKHKPDLAVVLATGYSWTVGSSMFREGDLAAILVRPYTKAGMYHALVTAKPGLISETV